VKYLYLFLFVLAISSCNRTKYVEFDGTITGVSEGTLVIKDPQGGQLLSAFITGGKIQVKNILQKPGFYDLYIVPDIQKDYKKKLYEVYLEGGKYTITADAAQLFLYPTIKSDSKIQNQLSDYYSVALAKTHAITTQGDSLSDMLYGKNTPVVVGSPEYNSLQKQFQTVTTEAGTIQAQTLSDYVNKNPQNDIEAFVLAQMDYKKQPEAFSKIYAKFTPEQKKHRQWEAGGRRSGPTYETCDRCSGTNYIGQNVGWKTIRP